MNSQKKIEINQSSLLGLKAELLRKKNEVSTAKYSQQISKVRVIKKKFTTKLDEANKGVDKRNERDAEEILEEANELKKSQKALEEKAKLYDKLTNSSSSANSDINSPFLVDFKQKQEETTADNTKESETVESDYGEYSEDEDEWVDFVDCLGRTKRCHRDDLEAMKEQDKKLHISLHGDPKPKEVEKEAECLADVQLPQLCSDDMKREILRQKWEEQERILLDKKNVHYQDVLFDEARSHGVGYYGFSTDETERARQQEELKKLRKETEKLQAATQSAAQRKQKQMEERLKAARRRKRERLGLPPEKESEEQPEVSEVKPEEPSTPVEEPRRDVRKAAPIRPWDIGKEGTTKVLTQEEWVERKRSERPEEFAPPTAQVKSYPKKRKFNRDFRETSVPFTMKPVPIDDELEEKGTRGRGVEVPPPPTFDMYGPSSKPKRPMPASRSDLDKSIEEGLNFLRKRVEERQGKSRRDEIDIM